MVGARQAGGRAAERGFQLYELVVVLAVLTITAVIGIPRVLEWTRQLRVDLAANELVGVRGWVRTRGPSCVDRGTSRADRAISGLSSVIEGI